VSDQSDRSASPPFAATELTGARILVLAAHPDDEVLGPGGTVAWSSGRAEAIRVWIASDGERQEGVTPDEAAAYGARRREESRQAAEILGTEPPRFAGLPDRQLASRSRELTSAVADLITDFKPDLIFAPAPSELHPDHRAVGEAVWEVVAASRPEDGNHDLFRFLRVAFYEISHPLLPNALVDIGATSGRKEAAFAAYASQQDVRDYAGATRGLNAYRRLTLSGTGPAEAFRVVSWAEASSTGLEEFRRAIGPAHVSDGSRGIAPVAVVVRTRNRPALLAEALESVRAQTARPVRVIVVNDGGASPREIAARFSGAFEIEVIELPSRRGRSAAANAGVAAAREPLVTLLDDDDRLFPDHLDRLTRAHRAGPEPVVYSDAVTVLYERRGEEWTARHRELQYSLDYDPDLLLLFNYIPIHTLLLPRALWEKTGGFDEGLEYSEDWDLILRLAAETPFRHVRAVTCEYRVFEPEPGDPAHTPAGSAAFQQAREKIYARYRERRSDAGLARAVDRLRAQLSFWSGRDAISQGELRYQRESHRRLFAENARLGEENGRLSASSEQLTSDLSAARHQVEALATREQELSEIAAEHQRLLREASGEIDRLSGILEQIYGSRTWKLHLFLDRIRGRG
jgi:LmbE family N-acetylglucosaminyl deacetylase/glycosyltransferase involved in cell wall biosynthesis